MSVQTSCIFTYIINMPDKYLAPDYIVPNVFLHPFPSVNINQSLFWILLFVRKGKKKKNRKTKTRDKVIHITNAALCNTICVTTTQQKLRNKEQSSYCTLCQCYLTASAPCSVQRKSAETHFGKITKCIYINILLFDPPNSHSRLQVLFFLSHFCILSLHFSEFHRKHHTQLFRLCGEIEPSECTSPDPRYSLISVRPGSHPKAT